MRLEKEFVVARPREALVGKLDEDATFASLFPGTQITSKRAGVRETRTPFSALGVSRDVRFVFRTQSSGCVRFEKICDGNIWRSLEGEVRLEPAGRAGTRVVLWMEGRTRALVPELAIRAPLRTQMDQMAESLRSHLEKA